MRTKIIEVMKFFNKPIVVPITQFTHACEQGTSRKYLEGINIFYSLLLRTNLKKTTLVNAKNSKKDS